MSDSNNCTCVPCNYPGGPPSYHLDCCMRMGIIEYDHDCPIEDHREMAVKQFGPKGSDDVEA